MDSMDSTITIIAIKYNLALYQLCIILYIEDIKMKLYNVELPEPIPENATEIIKCCRDIHQIHIDRRKRNTRMQQWDKYWVKAYNAVLKRIRK